MDFLTGFLAGVLIFGFYQKRKHRSAKERFQQFDVTKHHNQQRFVDQADFYPRKPVNPEAYKAVFSVVERTLAEITPKHRLLAEVSMGSFLGTSNEKGTRGQQNLAFRSINSKRVDFLVIDEFGYPKLVIEYHGSGHFQGSAEARDEVKRRALKRAGIPLLEFHEGVSAKEVGNRVRWWVTNR
ncbi:uncharacterized protein DUF2726 [Rhodovulum imhoffii]|uniref:Uncharacterized protein DUF2726 n=1 Tax=Rhodovulum imhoffii TaxID=365340 RepID=A0A2T5BVU6_9RHOB|nr:DUF2726 domain-containing protein [Rhodovulum imhoffii]MBK5933212.1 hypothetical protein [Rhodovulum imhoffii]PTN03687.1 uncharacterized protein DUF2726 [Rhodovulum imhoffii]